MRLTEIAKRIVEGMGNRVASIECGGVDFIQEMKGEVTKSIKDIDSKRENLEKNYEEFKVTQYAPAPGDNFASERAYNEFIRDKSNLEKEVITLGRRIQLLQAFVDNQRNMVNKIDDFDAIVEKIDRLIVAESQDFEKGLEFIRHGDVKSLSVSPKSANLKTALDMHKKTSRKISQGNESKGGDLENGPKAPSVR